MAFSRWKILIVCLCATMMVGVFARAESSAAIETIKKVSVNYAQRLPYFLRPLGLRLDAMGEQRGQNYQVFFPETPKDFRAPSVEEHHRSFAFTPHEKDTPEALAAKAVYDTVRNDLISTLQYLGESKNKSRDEKITQEALFGLAHKAFQSAGHAYLSGYLSKAIPQAKALSSDAGSGETFIHHLQKNLSSTVEQSVKKVLAELLASHPGSVPMDSAVIKRKTDELLLSGARNVIDAGLATARASDLYALRHLELEYRLSNSRDSFFSFLTTQPVYQTSDLRHSLFFQGGGIINEKSIDIDDDMRRHTFNIGASYRYLTVDEKYLFGANIFYDHQFPYNHSRMSLGLDARSGDLLLTGNYYIPLSDFQNSRTDEIGLEYEERALRGYDVEIGYEVPFLPGLSLFGKGYKYFSTVENNDDITGLSMSAEYDINRYFTIEGAMFAESGNQEQDRAEVSLRYSVPLFDPEENLLLADLETAGGEESMRFKIFEKVRRENRIRVEEQLRDTPENEALLLTAQFSAASLGLPFDVGGNLTGAGVNLPFDTVITIPNGDFGIITFNNGAIANISASGFGDVTLRFSRTTLTVLATNGGFVQFISSGGGITNIVVPGGMVALVGTDVDITDDGATTTIQVRAGEIDVTPDIGIDLENGLQGDIVNLTIATGVTTKLAGAALTTRQQSAFTNLDLINPDPPGIATAAPFITAQPSLITGPMVLGDNADIRFNLSQAVTVTGVPQLTGLVDAASRTFDYNSGASSPTQLVFRYTFIGADAGAVNITPQSLSLNGGTINSTANALPSLLAFTSPALPIMDLTPPMLTGSTPVDNAPLFSAADNIVLNFDENIQAGAGNIVITDTSDGSDIRTIPIGDAQINIVGANLTIDPTLDLETSTNYDITIVSGVIEDTNNNDFSGITTGNLNFTTSAETVPPLLMSSTPADNATEIQRSSNIVLNFNEPVNPGAGNIEIRRTLDNALVESIAVGAAAVTGGGTATITINPTLDLPFAEEVYVLIPAGGFVDLAANSFAGITGTTDLSFRTFSPLDVAGVVLWLDGADVNGNRVNPADGAGVNTWVDKGPNGTDISGTGAATYNTANSGVEFANTAQPFDDTYNRTGPNNTLSVFIVSTVGASGNSVLIETRNPRIAPGRIGVLGGGTPLSGNNNWASSPLNGKQMVSLEYTSAGGAVAYENATQTLNFPGAIALDASQRIVIGDDTTMGNQMIPGEFMHSILIYNADILNADRQRIEGFLAHKWGIAGLLPGGHPFAAAPP